MSAVTFHVLVHVKLADMDNATKQRLLLGTGQQGSSATFFTSQGPLVHDLVLDALCYRIAIRGATVDGEIHVRRAAEQRVMDALREIGVEARDLQVFVIDEKDAEPNDDND